jgi:hypothetical protein
MNTPQDTSPQVENGRDNKGRFAKGNKGGPGNPFARKVAELRAALVNFVTEDDMKHLCFVLKMRAEGGDMVAMKLLFQYVLGKPAVAVDPDRLDVDEWQKMQEKSRPPEEATTVLGGLPAQTVCEVTKVAWPCAVEQAFKQPLLAGLHAMDERDAEAKRRAEEPRPSPKGNNGRRREPAPMANGPNGPLPEWWEQMMAEALADTKRSRGDGPSPGNGRSR